jgi:hypothetical protein
VSTTAEEMWEEYRNGHHEDEVPLLVGIKASEVITKPVEWLWDKRIPKGKLTMFDGDPDVGKSVITMDLAARVSTGRTFPDGAPCEAGNVLIVNVEDAKDDTVVPRLKAHGADLERITIIDGMPTEDGVRLLDLPDDVPSLEASVKHYEASLLIIDPVLTMLGGDANKDQDARKALTPLRDMAEETGVTIVAVRHLNKNVSLSAIQRGGGNMGLIGVARAGAFFAHHPEVDGLRVMAPHKSNLAEKQPSLQYVIVPWAIDENIGRVEWRGVTEHDANSLAAENLSPHERTMKEEAMEFLRGLLTPGGLPSKRVKAEAREADISEATLRRAKDALRIKVRKDHDGPWYWSLPTKDAQAGQHEQVEHLEQVRKTPNSSDPAYLEEGAHVVQDAHVAQLGIDEHLHEHLGSNGNLLPADARKIEAFLLEPRPWLQKMLRDYGEYPERFREPTCRAVAAKALGTPDRWEEVVPILQGSS